VHTPHENGATLKARAHTHTQRQTHAQMLTLALPPQPEPFQSVAARSRRGGPGTMASARPLLVLIPARQRSVLEILAQLNGAAAWRGVAAQERAARGVGSRRADFHAERGCVGLLHPRQLVSVAGKLFQVHRVPHAGPGDCKGGGRPGGGRHGVREHRQRVSFEGGLFQGHKSTTGSTWRLQKRWATGRGRAGRTETSALATCT
jgi:hypothetical protein